MIKYIIVGKKWFDKANGNTYHSARVYDLNNHIVAAAPYQYGYGDNYIDSALEALKLAGVHSGIDLKYTDYFAICHENCKKIDVKHFGNVKI